jgi:hypothetical protein
MSDLRKPDWAIDAVARRFSAGWEPCKGSSPAGYLITSGRRIAVTSPGRFEKLLLVLPDGRVESLGD